MCVCVGESFLISFTEASRKEKMEIEIVLLLWLKVNVFVYACGKYACLYVVMWQFIEFINLIQDMKCAFKPNFEFYI